LRAASVSKYFLYSIQVVAAMVRSSPRARAGLSRLAASFCPAAPPAPIIVLPGFMRNEDVPRLYRAADAFVLPSRGEGWGRTYMEALASECPVIATRWSGQLDFLHDANSYLIDCHVVQAPPNVDVELYAGHGWAEPDFEQLRHTMRHVFTHRDEAKLRASQGRREMVERWDWDVVIQQWVAEFQRLLGN